MTKRQVTVNEKLSNRIANICFGFYILAAVFTLLLHFVTSRIDNGINKTRPFQDAWYLDEGMTLPADIKHPALKDGSCTFYAVVPDDIQKGDGLWFKNKSAYITVIVGGEERAQVVESRYQSLYGKTPGTDWIFVPLETADKGEIIKISFHTNYDDGSAYINEVSIGGGVASVQNAFSDVFVGSIVCVLMMVLGLLLIIVFISIRSLVKGHLEEFIYLGFCMFFTAIWSMSELRVFQIFTMKNAGIYHNLTCLTMMLIPLPLILHFRKDFDEVSPFITPVLSIMTVLNFVIGNVLHFAGIADFHETLIGTHVTIGVGAAFVIFANIRRVTKNIDRTAAEIAPAVCMALVAASGVTDIIMYKTGMTKDSAFFTRIAFFLYAMSLGVNSVRYVVKMLHIGMRAEIVERLAYEDGLTGLGNRTAYMEKLEELSGLALTVFVFDINNLKMTNDKYGHRAGNDLIRSGADIISEVFSRFSGCYRVGGDEFVCLAKGKVEGDELSDAFYARIKEFNEAGSLRFPLMIAMGYDFCEAGNDVKVAIDNADRRMYVKKGELKEAENRI